MPEAKEKRWPRSYRMTADDLARIDRLARAWGGIAPLEATAVIREALRRCEEGAGRGKKTRKIPER